MDNNLFKKHIKLFNERNENKNKVIEHIKNKTSIVLKENEIKIEKNIISINVSSIKKSIFHKYNLKEILKEIKLIYKN